MSIVLRALGLEKRDDFPPVSIPWSSEGKWGDGMVWQPYGQGGPVSVDRAMRISAVFGCLRLLSEAVATLPLDTFEKRGRIRLDYPKPQYLRFEGEDELQVSYLGQLMMSLLTDGNAYVATPRSPLGEPLGLTVLDPNQVKKYRVRKGQPDAGRIRFDIESEGKKGLTPLDIMHIPGMMFPGAITGISPIGYARESIGSALAAQDFGRSFFENGAQPSANLHFPGEKTRTQAQEIVDIWRETHGGTGKAGGIGVLSGGAELKTVTISQKDAQFIELRQFSVPDIARFYGVPPHLIADASNSTSWGSGLAEQNLAFGQFSLRNWLERIESAHNRLLRTDGRGKAFMKLNLDAVLRAALKDRYDAYAVGITNRFVTVDEAREKEDMPPLDPAAAIDARAVAELIQKLYLGTPDKLVLSADEARVIANAAGAGLTGPAPDPPAVPPAAPTHLPTPEVTK